MGYDGSITIGTKIDTNNFDSQISYIESQMQEIEYKLKQADMGFEVGDTMKLESQYEKLGTQLTNLKTKKMELNKTDFSSVGKSIDSFGSKIENTVKKVGRLALAVFGIRSAYLAIRSAASTLSQYNQQIGTDISYIQFALAKTLEPIIEGLIQLVFKLLSYVNMIAMAWFGVNLFAGATTDAFNKTNKSAEKLKKTIAGFDEMNVLSDNSSTSTATKTPSFDLSTPEDVKIPSWLQWILDNKDIVIAGLIGMAGGLIAISLGFKAMKGLGIGLILAGVSLLIQGIVDFIKDPSWHNFLTILQGIALIVAGIAILMGGWIVALIALGVAIVAYIIQNWDKVKVILGAVGSWIFNTIIKPIGNFFSGLWDGVKNGASSAWSWIKSVFSAVGSFFSGVFNTIGKIFKSIGQTIGNVIGTAFKTAINAVLATADLIINSPIRAINSLIGVINKVPGINLGTLNTVKIPRLASGGIVNYPGRGVYSNGTIRGEAGSEGVIPLTDSQAMETLGSAIGRYISLNATILTNINGRTINKELKRVDLNNAFATNR